jgi:pectinesterase
MIIAMKNATRLTRCSVILLAAGIMGGMSAQAFLGQGGAGQTARQVQRWPDAPMGFASLNTRGQNGTTGGKGGMTVTVQTQADLEKYAALPEPYIIRVQGAISMEPFGKEVSVSSNKTILGVGADAAIVHGGFNLRNVSNVIIRNLTIRDSYVEGDEDGKTNDFDAIQVDTSHHIWIDHCHLTRMGDGLLDLRKDTDYVTVSWCILSKHNKALGVGWTPNTDFRMTIHHNWIHDTTQRNPSFDNGMGHLYNNYLENIKSYGNYSRGRARVVVENSVFRKVNNPLQCDENAELSARGNIVEDSPGRNERKGPAFEPRKFYSYILDEAAHVPTLVKAGAGPQANIGNE